MHFETIAAIATPIGEGGLAVIRISGERAVAVADACFRPAGRKGVSLAAAASHTIHFGHVVRRVAGRDAGPPGLVAGAPGGESETIRRQVVKEEEIVDEVLVAVMRGPRTFTREDVVEISCHGGLLPAKTVLDTLLGRGARLAEPGEFTKRAFLNGRIDLAQAEAVADLIHSKTELALRAAAEQLEGKLSRRINELRDEMVKTLAHVEAHIDFPDEDIAPDTKQQLLARLERGIQLMDALLETANEGQLLRRGIRAAIIGEPNAGKSSLLNQLLGRERAIVSHIPGTTRDTIEETANIRGIPVVFIDTAGIREARDEIEEEGIRRSRQTLENAELVLHVSDASQPKDEPGASWTAPLDGRKVLRVLNKMDLLLSETAEQREAASDAVRISCKTGAGIEALKDAIRGRVWSGRIDGEMLQVAINSRHQNALLRAREATMRCVEALAGGETLELPAMELRIAVNAIGEIVGKTATEDILDVIFSQFCIGK